VARAIVTITGLGERDPVMVKDRALLFGHGFTAEALKHSAGMSRVLCWTRALPTLRSSQLHRGLLTIDKQAIAFSLALVADGSMA
jgi:hypothetical protein